MKDAYICVLDKHESHTPKSCCQLRCTLLISQKSEKCYASILHFCVPASLVQFQAFWRFNKALRFTFNSCKTVYTYSMALATVNIDKIIKVTSASSYV